jgi:hypothetical protein
MRLFLLSLYSYTFIDHQFKPAQLALLIPFSTFKTYLII